jgi:uncharacterized protein
MRTESNKVSTQPRRRSANPRPLPAAQTSGKAVSGKAVDIEYLYTHTSLVRYSFDPAKRASNQKKHGLDLADAARVIESGQTVTFEDRRFDYGEERFVTLGPLDGRLVVVVTAETENHIRIISMRKADRHEQGIYRENLG